MGANDAAHFATDRALQFGAVTIAPGTYTLFLMPKADRWELIVNRTTGMSGLDYNPAADLARIPLQVAPIREPAEWFTLDVNQTPTGGTLTVTWDRTTAYVPFRIQ